MDLAGAVEAAREIGYPVILRPSYVLGGRGMTIVPDEASLQAALQSGELFQISGDNPVLIDGFLHHAIEVDVDAVCDRDGRRLRRRHHGAHRGSRRAFGRFRLRPAAAFAVAGNHRRDRAADRRAGARTCTSVG